MALDMASLILPEAIVWLGMGVLKLGRSLTGAGQDSEPEPESRSLAPTAGHGAMTR